MFQGLRLLSAPVPAFSNVHFKFALKAVLSAHSLFIFWGKGSANIELQITETEQEFFFIQLFPDVDDDE